MDSQEIKQRVKKSYDTLPYPGLDSSINPNEAWNWVNIDWIGSLLPHAFEGAPPFKRILVAGCGTGNEAFQMLNRFPNAEITAVDYSESSIRIAQAHQQTQPKYTSIQFEVSDITTGTGKWMKSDYYDFISCHGVMSYIPNTQDVFNSLSACLSAEGVFYLGVNGATHSGISLRKSFEHFGYSSSSFEDTLETRRLIELFDRLRPHQEHMAGHTPSYLDSDILNTFSLNLTLSEWIEYADRSQLHLISSAELIPSISKTLSPKIFSLLFPKPRKEICELVALNTVAPFHHLVFSKMPSPSFPWKNLDALSNFRLQTTSLYSIQNPVSEIYGELILSGNIANANTVQFRWSEDTVATKLLDPKNNDQTIGNVLSDELESCKDNKNSLAIKIFMFYQLGLIKLLPNTASTS